MFYAVFHFIKYVLFRGGIQIIGILKFKAVDLDIVKAYSYFLIFKY